MYKLTQAIQQLEKEITNNKQIIYLQYEYLKVQVTHKLTAPPMLLLALAGGGLLSKAIKHRRKTRGQPLPAPHTKLAWTQKLITVYSELTVAIKLFNRLKAMAARLVRKSDGRVMVTH